jgi:hypothetical protein
MITGLELINEVEDRLGWRQTSSLDGDLRPDSRKLLRLLNRVMKSIQRLDDWPLLRKEDQLVTTAALDSEDYFSITNGEATLELGASASGDLAFSEEMKGRAVQIGSDATIYRIASVESPTSVTLNKKWVGDTLSDEEVSYTIAQDQYALPVDFDRPAKGWETFFEPYGVVPVGPDEFKKRRVKRGGYMHVDAPECFTIYGYTDNNYQQILHIDPFPSSEQILSYSYYCDHPEINSDNDRVLMPAAKLDAVIQGMIYLATRDYTDDQKMQLVLRDYMDALNKASGSPSTAEDITQITPSMTQKFKRRNQWGRGARINWGSLFNRSDRVGFD